MTTIDRRRSAERPLPPAAERIQQRLRNQETLSLEVARLVRELERHDQDRKGELAWSLRRANINDNRALALEEAHRRGELLRNGAEMPVRLSPRMQHLVAGFSSMPFFGAEAVWAHDDAVARQRKTERAAPRLFLQVTLHDPKAPDMYTRLSFTTNLPPGTDVSQLNPIDFDPLVVAYGQVGQNQEALLHRLESHPVEPPAR